MITQRYLAGVNKPNVTPCFCFSDRVANQVADYLSKKYGQHAQTIPFDFSEDDISMVIRLDFGGCQVEGWKEERICWADSESPVFFEFRFWSHDVDIVVGRLNEALKENRGLGFVELKRAWAGEASVCLDRGCAKFLLETIKEKMPEVQNRKQYNLGRYETAMSSLGDDNLQRLVFVEPPKPYSKLDKKERIRVQ